MLQKQMHSHKQNCGKIERMPRCHFLIESYICLRAHIIASIQTYDNMVFVSFYDQSMEEFQQLLRKQCKLSLIYASSIDNMNSNRRETPRVIIGRKIPYCFIVPSKKHIKQRIGYWIVQPMMTDGNEYMCPMVMMTNHFRSLIHHISANEFYRYITFSSTMANADIWRRFNHLAGFHAVLELSKKIVMRVKHLD